MATTDQMRIPTLEGLSFLDVRLSFTGGIDLETQHSSGAALIEALALGDDVTLTVSGKVKAKKHALGFDADGYEDPDKRKLTIIVAVDSIHTPELAAKRLVDTLAEDGITMTAEVTGDGS